jgi:putative ABC transport system permease protein
VLQVRFHGNAVPVAAGLRRIVHDLDLQVLLLPTTLRAQMDDNAENVWLIGKMLSFVAGVSVALALLGFYGMVGYSVTRRTRDFGIRSAIGRFSARRDASRLCHRSEARDGRNHRGNGSRVRLCIRRGKSVFQPAPVPLSSTNPMPYAAVAISLALAALAAMIGHARRAARIEPLTALREE